MGKKPDLAELQKQSREWHPKLLRFKPRNRLKKEPAVKPIPKSPTLKMKPGIPPYEFYVHPENKI